jgi:hypothetical protein
MRDATKGDPDDWYKVPQGVVTANICRISGKRPASGCYGSYVQEADGSYSTSSSVFTEYFAKGTVPSDTCPLHTYRVTLDTRIAEGSGEPATAPSVVPAAPGSAPADRAAPAAQVEARGGGDDDRADAKEPEKKKRGFWSRLFGRGKDKDDKGKEKDDDKKEDRP